MTQYARRFLKLIFATSPYRRCGTRVWSLRVRAWLFVASGWFLGGTLPPPCLAAGSDFTLASPEISAGVVATEQVLNAFGCTGRNISPALSWRGAPAATKSLALTFFDPDARQGAGFWHWLVINIPATATGLPRGASQRDLPAGSLPTRTDFGRPGYGGPCPPRRRCTTPLPVHALCA